MRISRFLMLMALLAAGCYVRNQMPDFGAEGKVYRSLAVDASGKLLDPVLVDPRKRSIEGLAVTRVGDEFVLTWSVPVKNDISPMQAVAVGGVVVSTVYPADGAPASYKGEATVDVEPGQTRLIAGTIRVPVRNLSRYALGAADLEGLFPAMSTWSRMDGIAFRSDALSFDYLGTKDGVASARWQAKAARGTHEMTTMSTDGKGRVLAAAKLNTADWPGTATCILLDKDGREAARDVASVPPRAAGETSASGVIRLQADAWKAIDWRKARVEWEWKAPAEKPQSRTIRLPVRAYCAGPCRVCQTTGCTAKHTDAYRPGIASDWTYLPAWTSIEVPGYGAGPALVDDTGGALRRAWRERQTPGIEVRFPTHAEARAWGCQWLSVRVLEG